MGYSYSRNANGRMVLDCDVCGGNPARKSRCPFTVKYADGGELPYCPAPALCEKCRPTYGTKAAHRATGCETGAARSQAAEAEKAALAIAGVYMTVSAYGDWHDRVPEGMVGVMATPGGLRDKASWTAARYYLVPASEYGARNGTFAIRDGLASWVGPDAA